MGVTGESAGGDREESNNKSERVRVKVKVRGGGEGEGEVRLNAKCNPERAGSGQGKLVDATDDWWTGGT